jgi:2-dehydro-3-deoxy-L-rhamnonate dehydrogenase (NAD+)
MPTLDLHQRIAVVTGAATGIGRAIAARLLTAGAAVCLWDRAPEALTNTAHDLTALGMVAAVTMDVTDPAAVSAAVQATRERLAASTFWSTMRASRGRTIRCGSIR